MKIQLLPDGTSNANSDDMAEADNASTMGGKYVVVTDHLLLKVVSLIVSDYFMNRLQEQIANKGNQQRYAEGMGANMRCINGGLL